MLAFLAREKPSLDVQTIDLCFLAALYLRAGSTSTASFLEDQLTDVFEQVARILDPTAEAPGRRATHSIRRLREQRLITRVDGAGVVRAGEFALSRLGTGIVEFYLEEEALTRESLTLLTRTLLSSLAEVAANADLARTEDDWRQGVAGPLSVIIGDLASGIERRQRGFDLQQVELQREIAELLVAEWFGALEQSQSLLESTSATLRDLNQVLLRDMQQAQSRLQDILERIADASESDDEAAVAGSRIAEAAAKDAVDQLDRITAWGAARQRAWSDYYQYVHRYLRDVVRLDPSRMLTQRLREQLAGKGGQRFALTIASAAPIRLLRAVAPPPLEKPPVRRPKKEREGEPVETEAEDPHEKLKGEVKRALEAGAKGLHEVTESLTNDLPAAERFARAGRIAQAVAEIVHPVAAAERPWVTLEGGLAIEEWTVRPGEEEEEEPPPPPSGQRSLDLFGEESE